IGKRPNMFQVGTNNREGAFLATQHLIDNGYRRIAMLNIGPDIYFADQRGEGYRDALAINQINYQEEYVRVCKPSDQETLRTCVIESVRSLFALSQKPDALFTTTDQLSTHSLGALHELGCRIPSDMALIGFSNTEFAGMLTPPLSTVHQPAFEIGRQAAEVLIGLISEKQPLSDVETIILPVRLEVRESSRFKD